MSPRSAVRYCKTSFHCFFVIIFLRFGPGLARCEIDLLRIGGPRKCVDVFLALGHGKASPPLGEIK